ncbi:MAG: hypothetical protein ACK5LJ_17900, partial [Paracoccus sp. (in: a-proteobacteria)]
RGEAISQQRTGNELGLIERMASGDDFLARMRLQGIRGNPWLNAFSALAGGAAGAYRGGGGSGTASSANSAVGPYAGGYRYPGG